MTYMTTKHTHCVGVNSRTKGEKLLISWPRRTFGDILLHSVSERSYTANLKAYIREPLFSNPKPWKQLLLLLVTPGLLLWVGEEGEQSSHGSFVLFAFSAREGAVTQVSAQIDLRLAL